MKKIILFLGFILSLNSMGDVISCDFTEPFFSLDYDTSSNQMVIFSDYNDEKKVIKNVELIFSGLNLLELKVEGELLAKLKFNYNGSNGMSDHYYPLEIELNYANKGFSQAKHFGGCTTKKLKALLPDFTN